MSVKFVDSSLLALALTAAVSAGITSWWTRRLEEQKVKSALCMPPRIPIDLNDSLIRSLSNVPYCTIKFSAKSQSSYLKTSIYYNPGIEGEERDL